MNLYSASIQWSFLVIFYKRKCKTTMEVCDTVVEWRNVIDYSQPWGNALFFQLEYIFLIQHHSCFHPVEMSTGKDLYRETKKLIAVLSMYVLRRCFTIHLLSDLEDNYCISFMHQIWIETTKLSWCRCKRSFHFDETCLSHRFNQRTRY